MKKQNLLKKVLIMLLLSMFVFSCANPDEVEPEDENPTVTPEDPETPDEPETPAADESKINFETAQYDGSHYYTDEDKTTAGVTGITGDVDTEIVKSGTQSYKLTGSVYKYNDNTDVIMLQRFKVLDILDVTSLDLSGKTITVNYYVPSDANDTQVKLVLLDSGYKGSESSATPITKGEWNTVYYKITAAVDASTPGYITQVDADGVEISGNAYTAQNDYGEGVFDISDLNLLEFRILGANDGDSATVYIDAIDWE